MWVGGCVTAPTAWASPPGRRTQECTQIGKNGLSVPFWGICVLCCAVGLGCGWPWDRNSVHKWEDRASPRRIGAFVYTVATREDRSSDRGDAGVYTNRPKWPLRAVLERLCTLLRRESRYELRRELCQVARAPQPPWRVGGAPSLAASPLVGKTGSERAAPLPGWHFGRGVNPHEPLKNPLSQCRPEGSQRQPGKPAIVNSSRASTPVFL